MTTTAWVRIQDAEKVHLAKIRPSVGPYLTGDAVWLACGKLTIMGDGTEIIAKTEYPRDIRCVRCSVVDAWLRREEA